MTVNDVAAFILAESGPMTAMKLQKLVNYSQAWSLVWDDRPLFENAFQAWANGPISPVLYERHRGRFQVAPGDVAGNPQALDAAAVQTVQNVLAFYGDKSAQWLSDLTHSEQPWAGVRAGLAPGERGDAEITHAAMAEYYGAL